MNNQEKSVELYYEYVYSNGEVTRKPAWIIESAGGPEEYFNSPFVKSWRLITKVK